MKVKEKSFSEALKEKRFELGYTQEEMAKAIGMKPRMYSYYENGDYDDKDTLKKRKYLQKLSEMKKENAQNILDNVALPIPPQGDPPITYYQKENEFLRNLVNDLVALMKSKEQKAASKSTNSENPLLSN